MKPAGPILPTRALLYQHCRGYDPDVIRSGDLLTRDHISIWCPVCDHLVTGPDVAAAVNDWNDHCIARISAGSPR